DRLVKELTPNGVIHRWSQAGAPLAQALELGIGSMHRLTRALLKSGRSEVLPLLYIHSPGEPAYEAVGGYAKSLRQEQPKLRLTSLAAGSINAGEVLAELQAESLE